MPRKALLAKVDRVQQYVKERQTSAMHAEKKLQDAGLEIRADDREIRMIIVDSG